MANDAGKPEEMPHFPPGSGSWADNPPRKRSGNGIPERDRLFLA